jgi:DNA polymerase III sliding clamp (beta) subunit (PCNA family)
MRFTVDGRVLYNAVRACELAMCDDESRTQLCGVHFDADAGHPALVATNGRWLARVRLTVKVTGASVAGTLPAGYLRDLMNLCKSPGDVTVDLSLGTFRAMTSRGTVVTETLAGEFPPYRAVISAPSKNGGEWGVDPLFLHDAAEAVRRWLSIASWRKGPAERPTIKVRAPGDALDAKRLDVSTDAGDLTVVLMPKRLP